MKRSLVILVIGAACAAPGVATQHSAPVLASDSRGNLRLETGDVTATSVRDSIAAPQATVYGVVKQVYAALGVPVTLDNPAAGQIGNPSFWKTRRFAEHPMSDLASCGNSMTGPRANDYRIYMSLITRVVPTTSGGSRLETTFVPIAQDVAGGSTDRIPCGSTGKLEQIIHVSVAATLGKADTPR